MIVITQKFPLQLLIGFLLVLSACRKGEATETIEIPKIAQIRVPTSMRPVQNLNEAAVLQYRDASRKLYLVVLVDAKEAVATDFVDLNLEEYYEFAFRNIENNLLNVQAVQRDTAAGASLIYGDIEGEFSGKVLYYKIGVLEIGEYFLQVIIYTLQEQREQLEPVMQKILFSVKPLGED